MSTPSARLRESKARQRILDAKLKDLEFSNRIFQAQQAETEEPDEVGERKQLSASPEGLRAIPERKEEGGRRAEVPSPGSEEEHPDDLSSDDLALLKVCHALPVLTTMPCHFNLQSLLNRKYIAM